MPRTAQDSDQSGIRYVELFSFSGTSILGTLRKIIRGKITVASNPKQKISEGFRESRFHYILISFHYYLDVM